MFRVVQIFLIILAISLIWIVVAPQLVLGATTKSATKKKRVKFGSNVKIVNAGGNKQDRYNPDLRSCVQRNAELALRVGGAKKLAEITLQEADESSSASRR